MIATFTDIAFAYLIQRFIKNAWFGYIVALIAGIAINFASVTITAYMLGMYFHESEVSVALAAGLIRHPAIVITAYTLFLLSAKWSKKKQVATE